MKTHGPPKLIAGFEALARCVLVSPQCPRDSWWRVAALKALVEEVIEDRGDIDRSRLYVTGLSMGGYGIWSLISQLILNQPWGVRAGVPGNGSGVRAAASERPASGP